MVGPTTSAWVRSAKPTERWSNTPVGGFASGCVSNTKSREEGTLGFLRRPCISGLAWSDLQSGPPAFRGRQRETFSESWMRQLRLSSSISGGVETRHGVATEAPANERAGLG